MHGNLRPMNHFARIIIFIIAISDGKSKDFDVKHMIVDFEGKTTECFVDSLGYQYIYFIPKDSVDTDSVKLKDLYYVYNDFDRVFYYSWSFEENVRRMENRTGKIFLINGDTLDFIDLKFNNDMIEPEIFVKTGIKRSTYISMFDVERIETDFSIMSYSVKQGFYYSLSSFIIASTLDVVRNWDRERRAIPQIWDQYNDLLPKISVIGLNKQQGTGVTYQSLTSLIPLSVGFAMVYDIYRQKNKFYFTPVYEDKSFGRNMYVFSIENIVKKQFESVIFNLEKSKIGSKLLRLFR